jgi:hypothetical protein
MRRTFLMLICMLAICPQNAFAQPLFITEHNWTVNVGEATFGMRQVADVTSTRPEFQYTIIYLGWTGFTVPFRAPYILMGLIGVVTAIVLLEWLRSWRVRSQSPA